MRAAITVTVLAASLAGCSLFDSGRSWQSGKFEVIWVDLRSNSHLAYRLDSSASIGIVDSCVFAAAENDNSIVVQQRSPGSSGSSYYVIAKSKYDPLQELGDAIIGPLSESEFLVLRKALSLPTPEPVISEAVCNITA